MKSDGFRSGNSSYVGIGPGFNFTHQDFERATAGPGGSRIDFGDFSGDTALNILGGIRYRSGLFTEIKASVCATPSPTLQLIVGYNFWRIVSWFYINNAGPAGL